MRALVSSGRSDFDSSWPVTCDSPVSGSAVTATIAALPPVAAAASKPVARTVMTLIASLERLPSRARCPRRSAARTCRGSRPTMISEICATSSSAAMRGIAFLPNPVAGGEHVRIAARLDDRHRRPPRRSRRWGSRNAARRRAAPWPRRRSLPPPARRALAFEPATSTWMSPPIRCAAVTVLSTAACSDALSWSAMTSVVMR